MTFMAQVLASGISFFSDCIGWPPEYLDALQRIRNEGHDIDRSEFLANVHWTLDKAPNDFIPEDDWHISYWKYEKIFFFIHSGIEYVFASPHDIEKLQDLIDREDLDPESDVYSYDFYVKSEKETGNRLFVVNRRKLLEQTKSKDLLEKALKDNDQECVRIAKKRLETLK